MSSSSSSEDKPDLERKIVEAIAGSNAADTDEEEEDGNGGKEPAAAEEEQEGSLTGHRSRSASPKQTSNEQEDEAGQRR